MLVKYLRALFCCFVTRDASSGEQMVFGKRITQVSVPNYSKTYQITVTSGSGSRHEVAPADGIFHIYAEGANSIGSTPKVWGTQFGMLCRHAGSSVIATYVPVKKGEVMLLQFNANPVTITFTPNE